MISTNESVEPDDREVVETIRNGEPEAFEQLVRRKTSKVYSLCYRIIGNAEDAKDISQLVFIKLWENLQKYDPAYAFDTWLYRMLTNVEIHFMSNKQPP
jgi:RNA polymerase sigma-70 factor (ECF subfamily)